MYLEDFLEVEEGFFSYEHAQIYYREVLFSSLTGQILAFE